MPYPILRVSGAPTRVPVRAQRGPCSPVSCPLVLDCFWTSIAVPPLRSPAPGAASRRGQETGEQGEDFLWGSRARATVSRGQAGEGRARAAVLWWGCGEGGSLT